MVGSFVVLYLFLGGCGAAVVLVAAIWSLLLGRTRTRTAEQTRAFTALRARLFAAGLVLLVLGSLCLLLDLGRPERFILLFVCPTASVISAGTFLLSGCILAAALLAVADFALVRWMSRGARRVLEAAAAALACGVMLYTGLYMAWLEAVPLWNNAALPVLLALSSASSGAAVVMLAVPFGRDWRLLSGWVRALRRAHCAVLVLEALALAAFLAIAAADPFAAASLPTLLAPDGLGPWFVVGFGVLGLLTPLIAEAIRSFLGLAAPAPAAEALCVAGGLILRFCLVLAASH
ncbi:NrfD/PsrC family molybdoenzyme membrane anchor subunit [uncultured Adlercreutzia sp.]|uniref:NrfD/PsrC family molybdoenzyme membrane anchor subunit n=1 Tax=uncultured Adlercreutzia sp. TaxID=875803 RepID=UPI00258994C9|nr:NrfD/PsrC family molybdoenzyme membrane anchor subunit [uncultured Adlercreutzia sp.]